MGSSLYQKFISKEPKIKTEKLDEVVVTGRGRVNWSDNPIPEDDKKKHPKFAQAIKAIDTYSGMKGGPKADDYFRKNIEEPAIKYNNRSYSLQALIPD